MTETHLPDDVVEQSASAIYDAPDTQSGDTVGTVIWNSEHLFYDTVEGEEIVDKARRASMPTCRDAARASLEAARWGELVEALTAIRGMLAGYAGQQTHMGDIYKIADAALSTIGEPNPDLGATKP